MWLVNLTRVTLMKAAPNKLIATNSVFLMVAVLKLTEYLQ